jgi:hypothetical protein
MGYIPQFVTYVIPIFPTRSIYDAIITKHQRLTLLLQESCEFGCLGATSPPFDTRLEWDCDQQRTLVGADFCIRRLLLCRGKWVYSKYWVLELTISKFLRLPRQAGWNSNIRLYILNLLISVLSKLLWPVRGEVTGGWRKLLNEELHNLQSAPRQILISMIKSMRMRWAGHIAPVGEMRNGMLNVGLEIWM